MRMTNLSKTFISGLALLYSQGAMAEYDTDANAPAYYPENEDDIIPNGKQSLDDTYEMFEYVTPQQELNKINTDTNEMRHFLQVVDEDLYDLNSDTEEIEEIHKQIESIRCTLDSHEAWLRNIYETVIADHGVRISEHEMRMKAHEERLNTLIAEHENRMLIHEATINDAQDILSDVEKLQDLIYKLTMNHHRRIAENEEIIDNSIIEVSKAIHEINIIQSDMGGKIEETQKRLKKLSNTPDADVPFEKENIMDDVSQTEEVEEAAYDQFIEDNKTPLEETQKRLKKLSNTPDADVPFEKENIMDDVSQTEEVEEAAYDQFIEDNKTPLAETSSNTQED